MSDGSQDPLLVDASDHVECLLGNEAIVRGALEAGVGFAAGYPGTPSSEVTDSFARIHKPAGIVFEYSVNEKIALEMAFAASLAGARSICAMKHLGLMYAGDPLSTIPYVGTVGGMLIVAAGDPACRTSPNEQDQRLLAPMLHIPVLDPSTPQQAYAMTRFAFELSEKSQLPVLLRPTTRVCHSRAVIRYGRLSTPRITGFTRDPKRFVPIPINARRLRIELKDRVEIARRMIADSEFFQIRGEGRQAILASGAPAATCADLLMETGIDRQVKILTLGGVYPLPEQQILESLKDVERVLVVEELSPYLEDAVRSLCARQGLKTEVLGKHTGHLPVEFEYEPDQIQRAIHDGLGLGAAPRPARLPEPLPPRPPTLCPGCPHRATQFAARTVFGEDHLYFNDIGCYTLGYGPPLNTADALLCMGAGFSLAAGVSRVTGQRTVGILGDSTFFHSGIPPLLNAIKENVNMVAVILDNQVTAMTGFQESPTVAMVGNQIVRDVSIQAVVRALGAKQVECVDPYNLPATIAAFERARDSQGVSVVISERACPVHHSRETHQPYKIATYAVDNGRCRTCGRECLGLRCGQEISECFERHMARSRSLEGGRKIAPRPARAPCSGRCPLGLCIQGYIGNIAAAQYDKALEHIMSQVVLPESVCRVCPHPCEDVCVRTEIDEPVAVNHLKRFVVEWAHQEQISYDPPRDPDSGKRVAVVGAGPAGLAAAHDLRLRGHQVTLYDRDSKPGGLLRTGIPAFRLPPEALERDVERVLGLGVEFVPDTKVGWDLTPEHLLSRGFEAVFVAVGASKEIALQVPDEGGDRSPRLTGALDYLNDANREESGPSGQQVVVIGGGNAAFDAARTALRKGARQVTIAYRREQKDMPAWTEEIEAALAEGVQLGTQLQPKRLEAGSLLCVRTQPGEPDESGRRRPVPQEGSDVSLPCDQLIVAIGQLAEAPLEADHESDGSLKTDPETCLTSVEKIYAGGDLTSSPRTVTDAIAAGRRAAWAIDRKLRGQEAADRRPPPPRPEKEILGRPGTDTADRTPRQRPRHLMAEDRRGHFKEVVSKFTETQARLEASRCLVCGQCGNCRTCLDLFGCPAFYVKEDQIHIDSNLCMGCGVCAEICTAGAIREVTSAPTASDEESALGPLEPTEEIGE